LPVTINVAAIRKRQRVNGERFELDHVQFDWR
jgi:hypothetical protein